MFGCQNGIMDQFLGLFTEGACSRLLSRQAWVDRCPGILWLFACHAGSPGHYGVHWIPYDLIWRGQNLNSCFREVYATLETGDTCPRCWSDHLPYLLETEWFFFGTFWIDHRGVLAWPTYWTKTTLPTSIDAPRLHSHCHPLLLSQFATTIGSSGIKTNY